MKRKVLLSIIGIALMLFLGITKSEAASANISVYPETVEVGQNASVTVSFTAAAWNLKVSGNVISGKSYASQTSDLSEQTTTETFNVNTSTEGTYTIYLSGDITDQNGDTVDINKYATITVKAPVQVGPGDDNGGKSEEPKSTNANLTDLGINPKDYDFHNFKSSRQSYTATVPYDVEKVEVWYKTADSNATVNVSGNNNLKVGKNTIKVVVTAEDGVSKKTYTITVTRQAQATTIETPNTPEEPQEEPVTVEEPEEIETEYTPQTEAGEGLKSLEIVGATFKEEFSTNTYEYVAVTEEKVDKVEINAEPTSEKYKIEVSGNENLIDGENLINIVVRDEDNAVVAIYQVTLMKNTIDQKAINGMFKEFQKEENIRKIGLISVLGLILVLIILYIIIKIKVKINEKRVYEEDNTKTEEDQRMIEQFLASMDNQDEEENSVNADAEENFTDFDIEENDNYDIDMENTNDIESDNDESEENTYIEQDTDQEQEMNSEEENIDEDLENDIELNNDTKTDEINETVEKKKGKHF